MTDTTKNQAAVALAKLSWASGKVSEARLRAARKNGKKGGRPKLQRPAPPAADQSEPGRTP